MVYNADYCKSFALVLKQGSDGDNVDYYLMMFFGRNMKKNNFVLFADPPNPSITVISVDLHISTSVISTPGKPVKQQRYLTKYVVCLETNVTLCRGVPDYI